MTNRLNTGKTLRYAGGAVPAGVPAGTARQGRTDEKKPARGGLGRNARYAQSKTGDSTPNTLCSLGLVVVYCK